MRQNTFEGKTKLSLSPFFERTCKLNQSQEWRRWSGFLSATKYELSHENEYFAIRTKAALLDISPLFKYIIEGPDAQFFLNHLVTRNMMVCKIGQVIYTPWCDEYGKQIDDGTIQRLSENKFRLTSAEPNLNWILLNSENLDVNIFDESKATAGLALQGPKSRDILNLISNDSLDNLKFFHIIDTTFGNIPVSISRTGYTGDLGYEIWINKKDALDVWDIIMEKGSIYGITPAGLYALDIARIEAGLILLDVDYISAKNAIIESRKSSPLELGLDWTVKIDKENFIGKKALENDLLSGVKWKFIGIEIEWDSFQKIHKEIGLAPELPSIAWRSSVPIYNYNKQVGYATSGSWSPILKKYIALAHIKSEFLLGNTNLKIEINLEHFKKLIPINIVKTPFFNPKRKTSCLK